MEPRALARRLLASSFFMAGAFGLLAVAAAAKLVSLEAGVLVLGTAAILVAGSAVGLAPLARSIARRSDAFRTTRYGNLAFVLFATFAFQAPAAERLLFPMPLLGFGAALYLPQARAILAGLASSAAESRRLLRRWSLALNLGCALGALGALLLLARYDLRNTFLAGIGLAAFSFFSLPRNAGRA